MTYAILLQTDFNMEIRENIRGTKANEKFSNEHIAKIYPKGKKIKMCVNGFEFYAIVKSVIRVYEDSSAVVMY